MVFTAVLVLHATTNWMQLKYPEDEEPTKRLGGCDTQLEARTPKSNSVKQLDKHKTCMKKRNTWTL
jgi:hypothetical protein